MELLTLPLMPGSTTSILHPINVLGASWAILRHALSSLNPDTAIVRRIHHTHRTRSARGAATETQGGADTASVASSRGSRRSNGGSISEAATAGAPVGSSTNGANHHHHRTRSGEHEALRSSRNHRHHRTSSQESESTAMVAADDAGGGGAAASLTSSARRTRSAEDPLAAARRSAAAADGGEAASLPRVHRSHSDGPRERSNRHTGSSGGGSGSGTTTPRLSAPHTLSPAATAVAASGLTPPLAPLPLVSRVGLGKPPLSSRHRSTTTVGETAAADTSSSSRHRHHRSGSGSGGLSNSGRSSHSRRSGGGDDDSNEGSVIVIRDGTGISLGSGTGELPIFPSLFNGTVSDKSLSWSLREWWNRIRAMKMTRSAFLLNHVLHAVPVMVVHYCCELKRQLVTLPLLRFSDTCVKFTSALRTHREGDSVALPVVNAGAAATTTIHYDTKIATEWPPTEEVFEKLPAATVGHVLLTRWMLQAVESYIEKLFFFDETLVVRQLRSKRMLRRVVGWSLRVFSHTIFDPFLLSIVVPILLSSSSSSSADFAEPADVPRVLLTVPGLIRGLGISATSVMIQWIVMPTASRLVYRGFLTMFEVVEYLTTRRYAHWSEQDDDDFDEEGERDDVTDDGASLASGMNGANTSTAGFSAASGRPPESHSGFQQRIGSAPTAEDRARRAQRHLHREQRKRRALRQAAREQAMRRTILRAIVYRVISSVAAQALVDHPLSVLVELLRGRATLHLTGLLTPYAGMTAARDGLTWANLGSYATALATPAVNIEGEEEDDAHVPPALMALRRVGRDMAHELLVISSSVLDTSGQRDTLAVVEHRAAEKLAQGEVTSAADSAEFLMRSVMSLSPFYYGLQFTVIDKVLTFYMAVWIRLTKQ